MTPTLLLIISLALIIICVLALAVTVHYAGFSKPVLGFGPALGIGTGLLGILAALIWFCF